MIATIATLTPALAKELGLGANAEGVAVIEWRFPSFHQTSRPERECRLSNCTSTSRTSSPSTALTPKLIDDFVAGIVSIRGIPSAKGRKADNIGTIRREFVSAC